jgi:hypothetical protein
MANIEIIQKVWTMQIIIALIMIMFFNKNKLIKPISFFAFSVTVFLWGRLILNVFLNTPIVLAGVKITDENILYSSLILGIAISIIMLVYTISYSWFDNILKYYVTRSKFTLPKYLSSAIVALSIIFILVFMLDSYRKMGIVMSSNYLEVAGSNVLSSGIKYFTLAKLLIMVWVIGGGNPNRFYYASIILVIGAIGFLLIGLRGYAFSYMFLWLYFQNNKKEIKIYKLLVLSMSLIILANVVLEYRLGFSVSKGLLNIIIDTFHSQGASFEVVFGSIIFKNKLISQLPLAEFLLKGNFGHYVDTVRSVNFAYGGFASSWFAEAYYLGMPFYIALSVVLGIIISFIDRVSEISTSNMNRINNNYLNIILFLTIPNLVFFARSSVFDLMSKFIETMFIITFIIVMFNVKINKDESLIDGRE